MENSSREDPFEEENRVESTRRILFSLDFREREREREIFIALFEMECEWDR